MKAEMILWRDPHTILDPWTPLPELCMDAKRVLTIGLVVKENDDTLAITIGAIVGDDDVMGTLILPKSAIIQRSVVGSDEDIATWLKGNAWPR